MMLGCYEFTVSLLNSVLMIKSYSDGLNKLYQSEITDITLTPDLKILFGKCNVVFEVMKKRCLADKNNVTFTDEGILAITYSRNVEGTDIKNDLVFVLGEVTLDETQRLRLKVTKFEKILEEFRQQS